MGKLNFNYGTMRTAKSATLIMEAFNYRNSGVKIEVIKPVFDSRDSATEIVSRIGGRTSARPMANLNGYAPEVGTKFILIDEVQFFSTTDMDILARIAVTTDIQIDCYGLMTDSNEHIFPASRRLIEVGATLVPVKPTCCMISGCPQHATHHLRVDKNGNVVRDGTQMELGDSQFQSVCRDHYYALYHGVTRGKGR